jgi:glycosyltransferase involved in cell wall biosynthesis
MKISVVIPAYNEEKLLKKCLESLKNQIEKPFEIIVVDNNSTDKTAEVAQKMGAIVVKELKQGISFARNAGFNAANGDVIARLDADTVAPKDWILKIRKILEKGVEAVSGPASYLNLPGKIQFSHLPSLYYFRFLKLLFKNHMLFGLNMALKKSLWDKVKDELCMDNKKVHEDFDLAIHLWKYAKIEFDKDLKVATSPRKWKSLRSDVEYTARFVRMLRSHGLIHFPLKIQSLG